MLIYKINFSLLTFFSLLIFLWAWPKMLFIGSHAPEKDEDEDSQLYFYLLLLAINA